MILFGFVGLVVLVARRRSTSSSAAGVAGLVVVVIIAAALALFSYYNSDKVALAASHAKPADETEYRRYHNLVEGLCIAAGLPKPRLYVVDDPAPEHVRDRPEPEARRDRRHHRSAREDEPRGARRRARARAVARQELRHPRHHGRGHRGRCDRAARRHRAAVRVLGRAQRRSRRDSNDSGGLGGIVALLALALLVLAPFAGYLMQFAMSRNREYLADASGVQLTRYPPGLISALEKLRDDHAVVHHATKATAQMWIEQPLEPAGRRQEGRPARASTTCSTPTLRSKTGSSASRRCK